MGKVIITISKNRKVKLSRDFIGVCGEQNHEELLVDFDKPADFIDGDASVVIDKNGEKKSFTLEKQDGIYYKTAITSEFTNCAGRLKMQVEVKPAESEMFKSEVFTMICKESV